jgi:hypothetical protein
MTSDNLLQGLNNIGSINSNRVNLLDDEELWKSIESSIKTRREQDHGYANVIYEGLLQQIHDFENTLNADEEIAAYLSSFGQTMLIQINKVSYLDPFFIIFYGSNFDDGRQVRLVQHTTQLNVLFTSIKLNPEEKRVVRRIGFCIANEHKDTNID